MLENAMRSIRHNRSLMTKGQVHEYNASISDDFFAVFSLGRDGTYETYTAEQYRAGNIEALRFYEGKNPCWDYTDLRWGSRFNDTELVVSSHINFSLNGDVIMEALCTEVYRLTDGRWMMVRQYMEKYIPQSLLTEG